MKVKPTQVAQMIIDDPKDDLVWIRPSKPRHFRSGRDAFKEYLQHFGKWLILSRNRAYFEEGKIHSAKYNREPALSLRVPLLRVYIVTIGKGRKFGKFSVASA